MKKITKKIVFGLFTSLGLLSGLQMNAQLGLTASASNLCYSGTNQVTCAVSVSVTGTASYSWSYISYPCGPAPIIAGTSSSVVLNLPCVGSYSISCIALNSSSISIGQNFVNVIVSPTPTISVTPNQTICTGGSVNLIANGANTYTWITGATMPSIAIIPTVSTCYVVAGTNSLGCTSTATSCVTLTNTPLPISANSQTVCKGSSANFTASGAISYWWSTTPTINTASINVLPMVSTNYSVYGTFTNNCMGMSIVNVIVDTTCSNVWPGDANNDGVVNNTDVFEIGLAYNNTGTARSPGGNAYTSQFANNWSGTVSTGKNKCHADCNGDGTVNNSDTLAIYNNYLLTHSFKESGVTVNPDIYFASTSQIVQEGAWSKVDILLGSTASPVNSLYGVAFDVNFDNTLIQTNSAYIVYTASFLNASNQNVQFRKGDLSNGKIYAASVRVDGANVSGNGKIGEFWFKPKTGLAANTVLNLSVANSSKISNNNVSSTLGGGSSTLTIVKNSVGISENKLEANIQIYPNPASNQVQISFLENTFVNYTMIDIVGRVVANGEFTGSKTLDVSNFANGSYMIRFESNKQTSFKKLIIEK